MKKLSCHPRFCGREEFGRGGPRGMRNGGCGNSRVLNTPIKIGHLLDVTCWKLKYLRGLA